MKRVSIVLLAFIALPMIGLSASQRDDGARAPRGSGLTIDWYTVDGGGKMNTAAGQMELSGTIAQADAGVTMTGGEFSVTGGFWVGALGPAAHTCLCGDLDGDGEVGLTDFTTFAKCFHLTAATQPDSEDCSQEEFWCSDLDGDGEVGLDDFVTFTNLFRQPASGSPPNCE